MHGVPGQCVVLHVIRVGLHRSRNDGAHADKHCDGKDENQQGGGA